MRNGGIVINPYAVPSIIHYSFFIIHHSFLGTSRSPYPTIYNFIGATHENDQWSPLQCYINVSMKFVWVILRA